MKISLLKGFTLTEVMVTVAVVALTLSFAAPNIKAAVRNNRLAGAANQFISALSLARSEAVKRRMRVTVRKNSANWEQGWQIFTDSPSANGAYGILNNTDVILRVYGPLPANYTLRGNNNFTNYISFLPSGESNQLGSFALCENGAGNVKPASGTSRLIIVNSVGRVRLGIDNNNNGIPEGDTGVDLDSCTSP